MGLWKKVYNNGFCIRTKEPSRVVKIGEEMLPRNSFCLDVGAGQGRNSIYLAKKGHLIRAIDAEDREFANSLDKNIKERIYFTKISFENFKLEKNKYDGVVLARFIQYFSLKEVKGFMDNIVESMKNKGYLMLSYVIKGGTPEKLLGAKKYSHDISVVRKLLVEKNMETIMCKEGSNSTTHLKKNYPIESYDLIMQLK